MSDNSAYYAPAAGQALKVAFGTYTNSELADLYDGYGSAWTAVPSPSYSAALTVGNGTISYYYFDLHGRIHYRFAFTLGSTSAIGTRPQVSDGVTHVGTFATGFGAAFDTSASRWHPIAVDMGSSDARFHVTSTAPFTWATGDILAGQWSRRITPTTTTRF